MMRNHDSRSGKSPSQPKSTVLSKSAANQPPVIQARSNEERLAECKEQQEKWARLGTPWMDKPPNMSEVQPWVQRKLTIGEPGDKYEQEADRVASKVVQQINTPVSTQPDQGQSVQAQEKLEEEELQAKHSSNVLQRREDLASGKTPEDLESAINKSRGGGLPLDASLQQSMGQAMGADFSGVRVHTDAQSDQLNQSLQAKAFTTGKDLFFRQGAYQPGNRGGQELIAHDLTHVVQQSGSKVQRDVSKLTPRIQRASVLSTLEDPPAGLKILLNGIDSDDGDAAKLTKLVSNFHSLTFTYTMRAVSDFQPLLQTGTLGGGDCGTLASAMMYVAKEYLQIETTKEKKVDFYVAAKTRTIDSGKVPNVESASGTKGVAWVFENHFWVKGPGGEYDALFGAVKNDSNWVDYEEAKIEGTTVNRVNCGNGTVLVGPALENDGSKSYIEVPSPIKELTVKQMAQRIAERNTKNLEERGQQGTKMGGSLDKTTVPKGLDSWADQNSSCCFITTACIKAKKLPDDCEELIVLRSFRDEYIRSIENGSQIISEYYRIAPKIVSCISALPDGESIFVKLYDQVIKSVNLVKAGENEEAMQNYISIVCDLRNQYL